jgi:putative glutamine amidotransferase
MNMAEKGTLQRDLHTLYEERAHLYTVLPRREVRVSRASHLFSVLQREVLSVNSLHFHAIAEPGRDIRVVAREPSGVVQAIEHAQRPFWIGVQWHPEYLPQRELQQRLFRALAESARKFKRARLPRAQTPGAQQLSGGLLNRASKISNP